MPIPTPRSNPLGTGPKSLESTDPFPLPSTQILPTGIWMGFPFLSVPKSPSKATTRLHISNSGLLFDLKITMSPT